MRALHKQRVPLLAQDRVDCGRCIRERRQWSKSARRRTNEVHVGECASEITEPDLCLSAKQYQLLVFQVGNRLHLRGLEVRMVRNALNGRILSELENLGAAKITSLKAVADLRIEVKVSIYELIRRITRRNA